MKKVFLAVVLVFGTYGCAPPIMPAAKMEDFYSKCIRIDQEYKATRSQIRATASPEEMRELVSSADEIKKIVAMSYSSMQYAENKYARQIAAIDIEGCTPLLLDEYLDIASLYMQKSEYQDAKRIYRDIVSSYPGRAWESYVRKAQFGLEDIREAESRPKRK